MPVYVPEREQALLSARREQAQALGVSADLTEDVLRRIMRESYQTQESGFVCCRNGGGKVVVVDPRKTETAIKSDKHIFIKPGSDVLFLIGIKAESYGTELIKH